MRPDNAWPEPLVPVRQPTDQTAAVQQLIRGSRPDRGRIDWDRVEVLLGHRLPADYRHLVDLIGPGRYGDITVHPPDESSDGLLRLHQRVYQFARNRRRDDPGLVQYPFHPEPNGFIAWGAAGDGWLLGWQAFCADPDQWPVMELNPEWSLARAVDFTCTAYIAAYLEEPIKRAKWTVSGRDRAGYTPFN
jgi:hypothetical protein